MEWSLAKVFFIIFEGYALKVASLENIIRSKKTLGRPRDLAVIEVLEKTLDEKKKR